MARTIVRGRPSRWHVLGVVCLSAGGACTGDIGGARTGADDIVPDDRTPTGVASPSGSSVTPPVASGAPPVTSGAPPITSGAPPAGPPSAGTPGGPLAIGPGFARRLNRTEYNNTVRDLLGRTLRPADEFPPDDVGNGFDNQGELLSVTTLHLENYERAAERLVDELFAAPAARRSQILTCDVATGGKACAREILTRFTRRAYRRAPGAADVDRLLGFLDVAAMNGGTAASGLGLAMRAVLISPRFLFRFEPPGAGGGRPLDDHELATRLSYLVWSSLPDEKLDQAADAKRLTTEGGLAAELERMLASPKAAGFVDGFGSQWLQTRELAAHDVDAKAFPAFDAPLRASLAEETRRFFGALVAEDRPVRELLTANHTFVNARLAKHYGLSTPATGTDHVRVTLPAGERRGLLGQGSVLTVTSYPNRTSPVMRGKWALSELLCAAPPPPPADVGVDEFEKKAGATTQRELLAQHRHQPACHACHMVMDEIGLGLEVFDGIGRVRTRDEAGKPIDASGVLPGGKTFTGAAALSQLLAGDERLLACVTRKVLTYAIGRGLDSRDDEAWIARVTADASRGGASIPAILRAVTASDLFRRRGT